jgi:hypothetical protein
MFPCSPSRVWLHLMNRFLHDGLNRRLRGLLWAFTIRLCPLYVIVALNSACTAYVAESHQIQCSMSKLPRCTALLQRTGLR